ncbi:Bystin [Gracilaria domingensis]|nr:Bystin [Gracilaria domingensis]
MLNTWPSRRRASRLWVLCNGRRARFNMGKKRARPISSFHKVDGPRENAPLHSQSFVDEVREARDVEFASEKRQTERSKRRKMMAEKELSEIKRKSKALEKAAKSSTGAAAKRIDARRAGLEMWKQAALRRNKAKSGRDAAEKDIDALNHQEATPDKLPSDAKASARILKEAKLQRQEIRRENLTNVAHEAAKKNAVLEVQLRGVGEKDDEHGDAFQESDSEGEDDRKSYVGTEVGFDDVEADEQELEFLDASKITEDEELALQYFTGMSDQKGASSDQELKSEPTGPRLMLADIILAKIREKEEAEAHAAEVAANPEKAERDRKIAEVYGLVGNIMSKYRSGKVPKAFKVISSQPNWEELMYLTRPDEWSPAAVFVATRVLASNLPAKEVIRFYRDVLLPRCMEDISEHKKLNYHLYRALEKAVYKPGAFCKGILFPVCEDRSCSLRQATIIGSIVRKVSIPMLHSAATMLYLSQLPYSPQVSLIMMALLEKKYALPYRVLDSIVDSFLKMKKDTRTFPVLWHKALLSFAQTYKMELTMEQKENLKLLMRIHTHYAITPEIRRELFSSRNRGDVMDPDANTIAKKIALAV